MCRLQTAELGVHMIVREWLGTCVRLLAVTAARISVPAEDA
jgi:hypothetical protein